MNEKKMHPADQVVETINRVYYAGLTTTSGGNISMMDEEGNIFITPSSIDKGTLTRRDIVKVTPSGEKIGLHKPSCELPFHSNVYKLRPDIKAIVHAHAPAVVAFALARQIPNIQITTHTKSLLSKISTSRYALPGSLKLGDIIKEEFAKGFDIVMMDAHGAVVGAKDLDTAFSLYESLDFCARMQINAQAIGCDLNGFTNQNTLAVPQLETFESGTYSNEEIDFRNELCNILARSYRLKIVNSTTGTFSRRLPSGGFLITPYGKDRSCLKPEDIVKIENGRQEAGKTASRAVKLHEYIYRAHPEINSVFMAQPPHIMAFILSEQELFNARLIPESYIMLREIKKIPFSALQDYAVLSDAITKETPIVMIDGECALSTGKDIVQAFDRMEVLEYSADSVISALRLGSVGRISDEEVTEIIDHFIN